MRKIISIVSFFMILGEIGNQELSVGQPLTLGQVIKVLILITIFYLSTRKYQK